MLLTPTRPIATRPAVISKPFKTTCKRFFLESLGRRKLEVHRFITYAQDEDGGLDAAFTLV